MLEDLDSAFQVNSARALDERHVAGLQILDEPLASSFRIRQEERSNSSRAGGGSQLFSISPHADNQIEPALKSTGVAYAVEPDRAAAIRLAFEKAAPGDVVLIAGKGHEKQQILADRTIPFDDAEIALCALGKLGYGEGQCI